LVTRLWAARQLEENLSAVVERAFALVIEMRGALCEEWAARKGWEVIDGGDENRKTAAKTATNTQVSLNTQEAIKRAIVRLLPLPPGSIVRSLVIGSRS
jgi:hypothetical protein